MAAGSNETKSEKMQENEKIEKTEDKKVNI